jgi:ferric-dicitrate binding protein FerR (iron transport regulator)
MALFDWLEQPENREYFNQLESVWNLTHATHRPVFDRAAGWAHVDASTSPMIGDVKASAKLSWMFSVRTLSAAAAILVILAGGIFVWLRVTTEVKLNTLATTDKPAEFTLPDQSHVTLYRNTVVRYPLVFNGSTREITMEHGEAFFKIAADKQKPFIIHTTTADIRVVGTEFNVTTREGRTEIGVQEGKVAVYNSVKKDSVYLIKGFTGIIRQTGDSVIANTTTDSNEWGYATRRLVFHNTPLKTAIKVIEKAYPYTITVSSENINRCNVTATFDNESVEKIVNLIAEILNLTVKRDDSGFILEGEGCP